MLYEICYDMIKPINNALHILIGSTNKFTEDTLSEIVLNIQNNNYDEIVFASTEYLSCCCLSDICSIARTLKAVFGDSCKIKIQTKCDDECNDFNCCYIDELLTYAELNT